MQGPTVQVFAQAAGTEWTPHSLELLGDAASLAKRVGGSVAAWLIPPLPEPSLRGALGLYGADDLFLLSPGPSTADDSRSVALAFAQTVAPSCRLILLPGDAKGEEIAAHLAALLDTEWLADALSFSATRQGALEITTVLAGGKLSRTHRTASARPLVATLREGVAESRKEGSRPFPRETPVAVSLEATEAPTAVVERRPADPRTQDIVLARKIVAGGRGTGGPEGMALVGKLGEALGASLAASRVAVDLGWAAAERQVGQTGKTVKPDLYVACGISGASHHLAGMRGAKHIVAINSDPEAPIHKVAHLSLRADLHTLVPRIVAVLERRRGKE